MTLSTAAMAVNLGSESVLVVDNGTGKILLEKNPDTVVPIASLTKLMTAMVVLDTRPDMDAPISIDKEDVDMLKHSRSRVPVGVTLTRRDVFQLALMSSDNRAAASLARTYPGGLTAFAVAVNAKIKALGMSHTVIEEPTGLSPHNQSTASDLIKMATAAAEYPMIRQITTSSKDLIRINGREVEYHNSNSLVGRKGWDIGLSKTGFTNEAGRCLIMRIKTATSTATLVLLNSNANSARVSDAMNIRRFLAVGDTPEARVEAVPTHHKRHIVRHSTPTHRRVAAAL